MNQNEFFNILMDGLKDFPETRLQDIISYYENNFVLGLDAGKTEEEIINQLGNPNLIVTKYRNENLKDPIESEFITTDVDITPNSNCTNYSNSNNNTNFINNDIAFAKDQNIVTDNKYSDFKTNDNFNNNNSNNIENDFEGNNTFKTSDSNKNINSNDAFYDIYNSNECADSTEDNYKSTPPNQSKCNFTNEVDLNVNNNSNSTSYNLHNAQNSDSNSNNFNIQNSKNKIPQFNINTFLKICIVILTLIIFFPVITGIIGCILGLFGIAISILVGSIGLLVGGTFTSFMGIPNIPMFVANFPYPVIVLFSLGSISLSIFLTLLFYYLCKLFIRISIKAYNSFQSKGGAF